MGTPSLWLLVPGWKIGEPCFYFFLLIFFACFEQVFRKSIVVSFLLITSSGGSFSPNLHFTRSLTRAFSPFNVIAGNKTKITIVTWYGVFICRGTLKLHVSDENFDYSDRYSPRPCPACCRLTSRWAKKWWGWQEYLGRIKIFKFFFLIQVFQLIILFTLMRRRICIIPVSLVLLLMFLKNLRSWFSRRSSSSSSSSSSRSSRLIAGVEFFFKLLYLCFFHQRCTRSIARRYSSGWEKIWIT